MSSRTFAWVFIASIVFILALGMTLWYENIDTQQWASMTLIVCVLVAYACGRMEQHDDEEVLRMRENACLSSSKPPQ